MNYNLPKRALRIVCTDGIQVLIKKSLHYLRYHTLVEAPREFYLRTAIRYWMNKVKFEAPALPFKVITIDPNEVDYFYSDISHRAGLGQILRENPKDSDYCFPIDDHWIYNGLTERFVDGIAWEDTVYCQIARERFQQQSEFWGYNNIREFRQKRLPYIESIYQQIKTKGYRPNYESGHQVPSDDKRAKELLHRDALEPLIVIGKDGEALWRNGFHRLTIARILDLTEIPVHVLGRHIDWQQFRDQIYTGLSMEKSLPQDSRLNHPDMNDIIP